MPKKVTTTIKEALRKEKPLGTIIEGNYALMFASRNPSDVIALMQRSEYFDCEVLDFSGTQAIAFRISDTPVANPQVDREGADIDAAGGVIVNELRKYPHKEVADMGDIAFLLSVPDNPIRQGRIMADLAAHADAFLRQRENTTSKRMV